MKNNTSSPIFRHFLPEIKKHFLWMILMLTGLTIVTIIDLQVPFYLKDIVDQIASGGSGAFEKTIIALKMIIICYVLAWIGWRINEFSVTQFQLRSLRDLFRRCFKRIEEHSYRFFTDSFAGSLVKKVSRFVTSFEVISDIIYFNFYKQALNLSIILYIFFNKNYSFGIILLIWIIVFLTINYFIGIWKMKYDKLAAEEDSKISGLLADSFSNFSSVKIFAQEKHENSLYEKLTYDWYKKYQFSWNLSNIMNAVQGSMMTMLEILLYYYTIKLWYKGIFTVGDFIFIQSYLITIFFNLWDFGRNIRSFYTHLSNAQEMADIFNKENEIVDIKNANKLDVKKGEIKFDNITFSYEENTKKIFKKFNLFIKPGEKIAFVGYTGEGKSTIIKLLFRFYNLNIGKILIDDQDISKVTQESLRKNISLVPQDPALFHRTIAENISYGKQNVSMEEIIKAAKQAQAHKFIMKCPDGYKTLVGERGVKLSGGEKQRIAIARVILEDAKILVLDEATSSLDSITEIEIQKAIENAMKGKTVIAIAHRLSTIKKVDRIIVLNNGEIVEEGTHNSLIRKKGHYSNLWSHQVGGFIIE